MPKKLIIIKKLKILRFIKSSIEGLIQKESFWVCQKESTFITLPITLLIISKD